MRTPVKRLFLFLPGLLLAHLLFLSGVAYAAEKRVLGDVTVKEGETAEEASTIWGDVTVEGNVRNGVESGFGNIWVEGPVGGDVDAGSGEVHINAPVGGNVDVGHGDVYLEDRAQVEGDVSHHSGSLYSEPNAVVGGPQTAGMAKSFNNNSSMSALPGAVGWTVMTLGLIAAAVLLAITAPGPLRASARSLDTIPVRALFVGLGSVPVAVVTSVLLAVTGIGVLLLFLLWPAYLALILFGALVTAYSLGRKVLFATGHYRAGDPLAAAVGAFLVSAAYLIPLFGGLVFAVLALLGTGGAVSALLARRPLVTPRATYASYKDYLEDRR